MGHYVKVLMDEVFGRKNFVNDITRIKCSPKNFARKGYGNIKDVILFYSKTGRHIWNDPREDFTDDDIERLFPKRDAQGRQYTTTPLHAPGETVNGETGAEWMGIKPPEGRHWRCSLAELTKLNEKGLIQWSKKKNPRKIIYADYVIGRGKKKQDIWRFKDPVYPEYPTEKNLEMLQMIIGASSNVGDLVLDCYCGSGSTLNGAEVLGRRWIGIDQSKVAVQTAIKKIMLVNNYATFKYFYFLKKKT